MAYMNLYMYKHEEFNMFVLQVSEVYCVRKYANKSTLPYTMAQSIQINKVIRHKGHS